MKLEMLFAYAYLWAFGFCSMQEYNECLDKMFLETPDVDVLLELETCSFNYKDTFFRLKRYFEYESNSFDVYQFGKTLFTGLEIIYNSNLYPIAEYSKMTYELWNLLPGTLRDEQPFWALSYADEPLSWGDEQQTRAMYEEAFSFYRKEHKTSSLSL